MAKLLSYYRLCPLIDIKTLLGITEDSEKGVVIVTLGRNIAIKYRLSDQKQLFSWRTKDKFSSAVHFDKKLGKYVAVFNQNFIRLWTEEDETLDKVKKYKFQQAIHAVITHNECTYVVFKTGSVYPLGEILGTRKDFAPAIIVEDVNIQAISYTSLEEDLYFGFLVKNDIESVFYWTVLNNDSKNVFSKYPLQVENASLKGLELFSSFKQVSLLSVWSDGKIYIKELSKHCKEQSSVGEMFIVLDNISANHFVKVLPLDDKYIAIYGSDPNEEGAILLIYNTQFKVTQSKQVHKLYTDEAKIWKIFNYILLPIGQNLIVVPFCLETEQLVSLIGTHKPMPNKIDSDISFVTDFELVKWDTEEDSSIGKKGKKVKMGKLKKRQPSDLLQNRVEELFKEGLSEAVIIEQIIPDILEDGNISLLEDCLSFFTDIPETYLAKILQFALSCNKKLFKRNDQKFNNLPEDMMPHGRAALLDKLLIRHFSDILILPHLRTTLSIEQATILLKYLVYLLSEDGHDLPTLSSFKTEKYIIKWVSLVVDSNYQKFILSKDDKIEDVLVKCKSAVMEQLDVLEILKTVAPVLARFQAEATGKKFANGRSADSLYSIEIVDY